MKKILFITVLSFFFLTNCSLGGDDINEQQIVRVLWHLENVTGGVSGIDDNFSPNVVVWEFNEINSTVTVTNDNDNGALEDGLDTGTYSYSITPIGTSSKTYLIIDSNEIGSITIGTNNKMVINQNETSSGPATDGYIYTFNKQIIVEN